MPTGKLAVLPLVLPHEELNRLWRWSALSLPEEACGCLLGQRSENEVRVERAFLGVNLERERPYERFDLDPRSLLHAERSARAAGQEVVGIWHSHPDGPALPSRRDREGAWEAWSYVIVSLAGGPREEAVRAWRLADGVFVEQPLAAF